VESAVRAVAEGKPSEESSAHVERARRAASSGDHDRAARGVAVDELGEGAHGLARVGKASVDVAVHAAGEPGVEAVGQRRGQAELRRALACEDDRVHAHLAEQHRERVDLFPVVATGEQAKGDEAESPDIRGRRDATFAIGLLGGHEERRSERLRPCLLAVGHELGDAEVEDLGGEGRLTPARDGEEDVLGLEIAMNDALRVGLLERVADLTEDLGDVAERQGPDALQAVGQLLALQQLHHQEGRAGLFVDAGGHHLDHVIAVDLRRGLRLEHEALTRRWIGRELRSHDLERALLARAELIDDVDGAHAPGAQGLHDAEIAAEDRIRLKHAHCLRPSVPAHASTSRGEYLLCVPTPARARSLARSLRSSGALVSPEQGEARER
jgi:hypothetical protein